MRSSVSGGVWALVLGGAGLGVASLIGEQPAGNEPPQTPLIAAPEVAQTAEVESDPGELAPPADRDFAVSAPRVSAAEAEIAEPPADTDPPAAPETTEVEAELNTPVEIDESEVVTSLEAPALPATEAAPLTVPTTNDTSVMTPQPPAPIVEADQAEAPSVTEIAEDVANFETPLPTDDASEVVEAEVETVLQPGVSDDGTLVWIDPETQTEVEALPAEVEPSVVETTENKMMVPDFGNFDDPQPSQDAPYIVEGGPSDLVPPSISEPSSEGVAMLPPIVVPEPSVAPEAGVSEQASDQPSGGSGAVAAPNVQPSDAAPETSESETAETAEATEETTTAQAEEPVAAAPEYGKRIRVNRPSAATTEGGEEAGSAPLAIGRTDPTALGRYATAFENPRGLPMISVMLLDDGSNGVMASELSAMPVPVTVVLNALDPNAADYMGAYRAYGIEVIMQASLPEGAVPTDVEVAFEAGFRSLPEAIALYSDGTGVLQSNRAAIDQAMQILSEDGRGLVTVQRGLGGALRAAEAAEVPAVTILRELDAKGEDQPAIERALDQSALRARQMGSAVLFGQVRAETISALTNWALSVDQEQMVLAPVSAVLKSMK
ncbi:divergent polysaccharide deacetylase family protein [Loktanella sp. S4079]|uniref:divergent polysaccharide deacetylase family protein n=1 Tax=Loktanella sp. S4079 TaxID=579483 RepID=UPI0006969BDB|nr:divergent polysaccharide deacetylase family protein [Loktanella sp. S4079]